MPIGRDERRNHRRNAVASLFGEEDADVALDLLEIVELAWHDCYDEVTPPEDVVDEMLLLSEGSVEKLIGAARLGLTDLRDLRVAADKRRG